MNLAYSVRLVFLCLAAFFLAQLAGGIVIRILSPAIVRRGRRLEPASAATMLFTMRILPAVFAIAVVAFLCIPSYVLFEQDTGAEAIGVLCVGCALLCTFDSIRAAARTVGAAAQSMRFLRRCSERGNPVSIPGEPSPVWVVEDCLPGLALAGILRPRFVISIELARVLPGEEFSAALRHERAHWESWDNLKRLLFLLTPDPVFLLGCFTRLEREWARATELAADDRAAGGSREACLCLAAALVQAARMGTKTNPLSLMSTLLSSPCDLMERVNRLLDPEPTPGRSKSRLSALAGSGSAALTVGLLAEGFAIGGCFNHLHEILEALMH